jgi:transposase, IS5 family
VVDATLINAPSATKNDKDERDPGMHQTQKGQQRYFGMTAYRGVDADSGLLHGQETDAWGDAGNQGIAKRPDAKATVNWHVAMRYSKRKVLDKGNAQMQ